MSGILNFHLWTKSDSRASNPGRDNFGQFSSVGASGRIKNRRTERTMGRQLSSDGPDSECIFCLGIHKLNHPKEIGVILVVI